MEYFNRVQYMVYYLCVTYNKRKKIFYHKRQFDGGWLLRGQKHFVFCVSTRTII